MACSASYSGQQRTFDNLQALVNAVNCELSAVRCEMRYRPLIVAAGFEVRADGTFELALVLFEVRAAVRAGSFDLLQIRLCDRRGVCHPASLFRSIRPGVRVL